MRNKTYLMRNRRYLYALLLSLLLSGLWKVGSAKERLPVIGAQVFIEPGQREEDIDLWFRRLHENGMNVCRIRMFEDYLKTTDGIWDFSLFDCAFKAADKYGIQVFATLFPSEANKSVGGFKFPYTLEHQQQVATYIREVVTHYSRFQSMYAWVLVNEPGTGGWIPDTPFTKQKWEEWKEQQTKPKSVSSGYPVLVNFDKERFLLYYNSWYLNWIADEVRKYDSLREIHVNNHQIFDNVAEYDFPAWRNFLTSFGTSAHPSWHFGYFTRSQYAAALSANCSLVRSGAGELPFWVTELQGGNNTYSGQKGFCPTKEEITQWLWTSIASGADGVIFWCLNPRSVGEEAGEWALLDFQNNASDRLSATASVTKCIQQNASLFKTSSTVATATTTSFATTPNIHILYTRESLWTEKKVQLNVTGDVDYEGRLPGGVMKSAISFYEVLMENGVNPGFKEIREFDWSKPDYCGQVLILAHQIALPSTQWELIRSFVRKGGKLIVEGLTAFYDENMISLSNTGFPLKDVFGGELKEVKCQPGDFLMYLSEPMPIHLWKGFICRESGETIGVEEGMTTAVRNHFGKGEVVWIPSLLGLGARRTTETAPLSRWLMKELSSVTDNLPFHFAKQEKGVLAQTLKRENTMLTVIINKTLAIRKIDCVVSGTKSRILFADKNGTLHRTSVTIHPEETMVIEWQ